MYYNNSNYAPRYYYPPTVRQNNSLGKAFNIAEYANSAAGASGIDTTMSDLGLIATQASRMIFAPQSISKPDNHLIGLVATCTFFVAGKLSGQKRLASFANLAVKFANDALINY